MASFPSWRRLHLDGEVSESGVRGNGFVTLLYLGREFGEKIIQFFVPF